MYIFKRIITVLLFFNLFPNFSKGNYLLEPEEVKSNETSIRFKFDDTWAYYSNWTLFRNMTSPRPDAKITFNCDPPSDTYRWCTLVSEQPLYRLWGHSASTACGVSPDGKEYQCKEYLCDKLYPPIGNVVLSRRVPTSGGEIQITGNYLRLCVDFPQYLNVPSSDVPKTLISGNIEDPNFNCNNLTVNFNPGSGLGSIQFQTSVKSFFSFLYAAPLVDLSNVYYDKSNSSLTINGENFYYKYIQLNLDGSDKTKDTTVTIKHYQMVVSNFTRIYGGPMRIEIIVNNVTMDFPQYYCFPTIPTSINSVSSLSGGTVTIKGSFFPQPGTNSTNVLINIGNETCEYIKSSSSELECYLQPRSKNTISNMPVSMSIIVNSTYCNNTGNPITFSYDIPILNNNVAIDPSNPRIITLNGNILGSTNTTTIQINGDSLNKLKPISVSDEAKIQFELPLLQCGNDIKLIVINNGNPSNEISFNVNIIAVPFHSPFVNNGSGLSIYLQYIKCPISSNIIPTLTFGSNTTSCTLPIIDATNDNQYYSTKCNVSPGTGSNHSINIKYDAQSYQTTFSYGAPIIFDYSNKNISINNSSTSIITVDGVNFNSNVSLFNATFFNRTIIPINGSLKDNQFKFILLDTDENDYINVTVDGIQNIERKFIELLPRNISFNDTQRVKTHNGKFQIFGKNLLSSQSNNPDYKLNVTANNKVCQINNDSITYNSLLVSIGNGVGSFSLSVYVGSNLEKSSIINYYDADIIEVNGKINNNNITITIIGNNFGEGGSVSIDQLSEPLDIPCNQLIYHNYDDDNITNSNSNTTAIRYHDQLICETVINKSHITTMDLSITLKNGNKITAPFNFTLIDISPTNEPSSAKSSGLSGGQKAGIAVGTVVGFSLIVVAAVAVVKNKLVSKTIDKIRSKQ